MSQPIRVGVSACLLGRNVRYDGGHKLDRYVTGILGRYFEFVPVCPEVECGLGVPREPMRLVGDPELPRLVTVKTGLDHTERLQSWAAGRVEELTEASLCGYILKAKSPSCGLARVKVYGDTGVPSLQGMGLFARAFMDCFPLVPVEDEGRLNDSKLRENFLERIFTLVRWRETLAGDGATGLVPRLISFQARHKLLFMAHSPQLARQLGKLTAEAANWPADGLRQAYETLLMRTLSLPASPAKHVNVLEHIMGYFKKLLSADEKAELREVFADYREGRVPLVVPVTLLAHYTRKYDVAYLKDQVYLRPHPADLALRNHV